MDRTGLRRSQEERRASQRLRGLWRKGDTHKASAATAKLDTAYVLLDAAIKKDALARSSEDRDLLAAWVSGLHVSPSVRRSLDTDVLVRLMTYVPAIPAEKVVVCHADEAAHFYFVYQGECTAYQVTDEEGVAYEGEADGGIARDSVLRQLAKRRNRESVAATRQQELDDWLQLARRLRSSRFRPRPAKWQALLLELTAAPQKAAALRQQRLHEARVRRARAEASEGAAVAAAAAGQEQEPPPPPPPPAAAAGDAPERAPRRIRRAHPGEGEKARAAQIVQTA